jgi:hypothetical protein
VPCILVPFLTGMNWLVDDSFKKSNKETVIEQKDKMEINAQLQDPDLEKTQTMNKFDALYNAYEHKEDFSAIKGIDDEGDKNLELDNKDLYSMNEMDKISQTNRLNSLDVPSVKGVSNFDMYKNGATANSFKTTKYTPTAPSYLSQYGNYEKPTSDYENYVNALKGSSNSSNNFTKTKEPPKSRFEEEMSLFKAQMTFIDSMTGKTSAPKKETAPKVESLNTETPTEVKDIKEVKKAGILRG